MELSIVILAGGKAKRLGVDKALITIKDKPLIAYTYENIRSISDDIIIITKSEKKQKQYQQVIKDQVKFFLDEDPSIESPLIGALTGFKNARNKYILLIGCDMPLIKLEVIELLYKYITGVRSLCLAVVPQFPNGYIEPLCAIYSKEEAIKALEQSIHEKFFRFKTFIDRMTAARFLPVIEIKQKDPKLLSFFNVNTRQDLIELFELLEDRD